MKSNAHLGLSFLLAGSRLIRELSVRGQFLGLYKGLEEAPQPLLVLRRRAHHRVYDLLHVPLARHIRVLERGQLLIRACMMSSQG